MFALLAGLGALGLLAFSVTPAAASKKKKESGIPANRLPWLADSDKQSALDAFRAMMFNPYAFSIGDMGVMTYYLHELGFTAEADMLADVALRASANVPPNHPYQNANPVVLASFNVDAFPSKAWGPRGMGGVNVGGYAEPPTPEPYHGYQLHNVWSSKFAEMGLKQTGQTQPQQNDELQAQMAAAAKAASEA